MPKLAEVIKFFNTEIAEARLSLHLLLLLFARIEQRAQSQTQDVKEVSDEQLSDLGVSLLRKLGTGAFPNSIAVDYLPDKELENMMESFMGKVFHIEGKNEETMEIEVVKYIVSGMFKEAAGGEYNGIWVVLMNKGTQTKSKKTATK